MAKLLLLAFISLFFISCENSDCQNQTSSNQESPANCPAPEPAPGPAPTPTPPGDVPNEALIFDAQVNMINFERLDEDKLMKAIEIIKKVIATSEFKKKVIDFEYGGKKAFIDNRGLSNAQIYQTLLDGQEKLLPEKDHEMDLELELYYENSSTVGFTRPSIMKISMNTKYFDVYSPSQVAGHVFHEWTHKLGFEHSKYRSSSRDASVPYAIGYMIRDLGKQFE
jgi:hypothetical protein